MHFLVDPLRRAGGLGLKARGCDLPGSGVTEVRLKVQEQSTWTAGSSLLLDTLLPEPRASWHGPSCLSLGADCLDCELPVSCHADTSSK